MCEQLSGRLPSSKRIRSPFILYHDFVLACRFTASHTKKQRTQIRYVYVMFPRVGLGLGVERYVYVAVNVCLYLFVPVYGGRVL